MAEADAINNLGYINDIRGEVLESISNYEAAQAIYVSINDKEGVATALGNIGAVYYKQGKVDLALENFNEALKIQEELKNEAGIATCYHNIGAIYGHHKEHKKARTYYLKALEIRERLGLDLHIARTLSNLGVEYQDLGKLDSAFLIWDRSLALKDKLGDRIGVVTLYLNIGDAFRDQQNFDSALALYTRALKISEEEAYQRSIAACLSRLAHLDLENGKIGDAKDFAERSLDIARKIGSPDRIADAAEMLSLIYEQEDNGMVALEMYRLYLLMHDSISKSEHRREAIRQSLEYEYAKKKANDRMEIEKTAAINKEAEKKRELIIYFVVAALLLVTIFMIVIFNRLKVTNKQKRIITDQKSQVDEAIKELNQFNEEIIQQRDQIETQKGILEASNDQLNKTNKQINHSINYARSVQENVLSTIEEVQQHFPKSFVLNMPKDILTGDFYWIREQNDLIYLVVADCTGHGIAGAMLTIVCNKILDQAIYLEKLTDPAKLLDYVHEEVVNRLQRADKTVDGMDLALCIFDQSKRKLKYAGAHNELLIVRNKELITLKADVRPIGYLAKPNFFPNFTTKTFDCEEGDSIYMTSDGYVDQFGGAGGKKLSTVAYCDLLIRIAGEPMEIQYQEVEKYLQEWKGDFNQLDDVCVLGFQIE